MTKFKDIRFPSFRNQETPPSRQQWVSHSGKRQKMRYLRMSCAKVLNDKTPEVQEAVQRVREFTAGQFEEYGTLMVIHQALDICDSTGISVEEALTIIIDKLENDKVREVAQGAIETIGKSRELEITVEGDENVESKTE